MSKTIHTRYTNDEDGVRVVVSEVRERTAGRPRQVRNACKEFGDSAKAEDDGLIFVHGVNHGEIKPDDILPPWED